MPARSKVAKKKKSPGRTRKVPARGNSVPRTSASKTGCYVTVTGLNVVVSSEKPKAGKTRGPLASVDDARSAAMDELLAAIEAAEERLGAIRRATTFDELRAAVNRS
jgi:hypothetical protein